MASTELTYLDHNATTPLCAEAWEAMLPFLRENWANPSSGYRFARAARQAVQQSREQVAALLGVTPEEIVFTSGGTESNNAAIRSAVALHPERRHLVTCATEHEAVLRPCEALAAQGYEVTVLPVDGEGRLDMDQYVAALRPGQTACVSLMWANNETGLIHPVADAAALAHERGILFHTDAVQAAGKVLLDLTSAPAHYVSLSAHKLHGPKGVGVLYVRASARFHPLMLGGGQEGGRRSGTLNVPGIVGLGAAAEAARMHLLSDHGALAARRDRLEAGLAARLTGVHVHAAAAPRLPNTSNFRLDGVDAQGAILLLDTHNICVSSGSACATGSIKPSHVLTAMGIGSRPARETLRVSLSRHTTDAEVDRVVDALEAAVRKLRISPP